MAKMRPPPAPSALRVAIVSRLRAKWLATALATPTPPMSSVARPTSVRNCEKRSTLRSSCGDALLRLRQSQSVLPAHQAAWLEKTGCAQRGLAAEQTRTEADAADELVRFSGQCRPQLELRIAD